MVACLTCHRDCSSCNGTAGSARAPSRYRAPPLGPAAGRVSPASELLAGTKSEAGTATVWGQSRLESGISLDLRFEMRFVRVA